jgi:hypothetical protein
VKVANAERLKAIESLSAWFEASVKELMVEVKVMRPKPEPGVSTKAQIIQTRIGNLF